MSATKICVAVAAFLLVGILTAHPAYGDCSISQKNKDGTWCFFCENGETAFQTINDDGVQCKCGKKDCSVTLNGDPSTFKAYSAAIEGGDGMIESSPSPSVAETVSDQVSSTSTGSSDTTTTSTDGNCSISQENKDGAWCLFCENGEATTQTFNDDGVQCKCGKKDCSVTLNGDPSTFKAYSAAIAAPTSEGGDGMIESTSSSSVAETVSEQVSSSSSSTGTSDTVTTTESSHGVMAAVSALIMAMAVMMTA